MEGPHSFMHYTNEEVLGVTAGDIVPIGGKRHLILKKTSTAIAARRWYFWDDWINKLTGGAWARE